MLRMMEALAHYAPNRLIAQTMAALPEPDQAALKRPEVRQWYLQTLREAQRHGPRGAQHDTAQLASSERAVREAPPQGDRRVPSPDPHRSRLTTAQPVLFVVFVRAWVAWCGVETLLLSSCLSAKH